MRLHILAVMLCAALPLRAQPLTEQTLYQKADTWQESLFGSLQRLEALEEQERAAAPMQVGDVQLGQWYAIASFSNVGGQGFAFAYPPEQEIALDKTYPGMNGTEASWRKVNFRDSEVINLLGQFKISEQAICYLYRTLTVPKDCEVTGYFGSDDGLAVWLNGQKLISEDVPRGPGPDQNSAKLSLKAGENHLLLKIVNRTGGWGYYFSLKPGGGKPEENPVRQRRFSQLWAKVRADFSSADAARQMRAETDDGIWPVGGDYTNLGAHLRRYRDASERRLGDSATVLAGLVTDLGPDGSAPERVLLDDLRAAPFPADSAGIAGASARFQATVRAGTLLHNRARLVSTGLAVEDLAHSFPDRYTSADEFRGRLKALAATGEALMGQGAPAGDDVARWDEDISTLQRQALVENNPLLDFGKLLFICRKPGGGNPGLPQNWQGNSSMRRTGWDTSIQVLSPVRPDGQRTTIFHSDSRFVGDLCLSFDGQKMLFSMPDATKNDRYEIWEIGADGQGLREITADAANDYDNYSGCYLPNGQIMFTSSRCYQAVPCTGGDHVALMYLMEADGSHVRQLTFDQDHSWYPTVMNDGRVIYTRWEYNDTPHYFSRILFTMNPDGTRQQAFYGTNSWYPNTMMYARPIPGSNTKIACIVSGHHGNPRMGELTIIDSSVGEREADGVLQIIPQRHRKPTAVIVDQYATGQWPQFVHPWPLSDKYFLVSCKPDPSGAWGIYLADVYDNLVPILIQPDAASMEPIPLVPRSTPPVITPAVDYARKDATVYLFDVYRGRAMEGVPRGTVKALRLVEPVYRYWGNGQTHSAAIDGGWDVKKIWGTVPVEEDGSAYFKVPANTPLMLQPINAENMAQQQMRSWLTAMPGEVLSCVGCHENRRDVAASGQRPLAQRRAPSEIKPWYGEPRGFSFAREVQPVLDRNCVGCHSGGRLNLRGADAPLQSRSPTTFSQSYVTLHPYVRRPGNESDIHALPPREFEATTSPLVQMLRKGHHGVQLSAEDWDRLITWIDLNVPFSGDWTEAEPKPPANLVARRAELQAEDLAVREHLAQQGGH